MTTHLLSLRRLVVEHRRLVLASGASALVAAALATGVQLADVQQRAANRTVEISASYRIVPSLEALTKQADLIVSGDVLSQSPTRMVAPPAQALQPFAPAGAKAAPPDKAQQLAGHIPSLPKGEPAPPSQDQPVTDYTIRIDRVLKGTLASGSTITVTQTGGTVELPTYPGGPKLSRTLILEHDPLMAPGQQHLLFLSRTSDGRYYVVGGPQGRFSIDRGGKVHPIDPAAPAGRGHAGETLEGLAAEVGALAK